MIIEDKTKIYKKIISELSIGDCFKYEGNTYVRAGYGSYISIQTNENVSVAFNLKTNKLVALYNTTFVEPINAKVVIE